MSASAPVFNPARPVLAPGSAAFAAAKAAGTRGKAGMSGRVPGGDDVDNHDLNGSGMKEEEEVDASDAEDGEGAESSAAAAAATAAGVAKSRVTRPLPNSRRAGAGADFVPKAATVPRSAAEKENTRRLIVVLSQVSRRVCDVALCSDWVDHRDVLRMRSWGWARSNAC